jgi:serine/threonine protein kinase
MTLPDSRWQTIQESEFPWERDALDFIRQRLPDRDPYHAWSNFEFVAQDGSINEIDLLVLGPRGLFLVEIKSRPGVLTGDAGTWTWETEGRRRLQDNPLLLANRKAKKLASLLRTSRSFPAGRAPYVQAAIFLSAPSLKLRLDERGRLNVYLRDVPPTEGNAEGRPGIVDCVTRPPSPSQGTAPGRNPGAPPGIDRILAKAISRAMKDVGIRPTQRSRQVGDFVLEQLAFEGPGYQDWEARHVALEGIRRRVRLYPVALGSSTLSRRTLERAAQREFQILDGIRHPGILKAVAFTESDRGPALVFEQEQGAQRLDLFLRQRGDTLSMETRLAVLRQIAEALDHAHRKRLFHRALSPQSILVDNPEADTPRVRIFNWQTGRRDPGTGAATGADATQTTHMDELIEETARVYVAPEALRDQEADARTMDVFSLGALAFHIFTGRPPGEDSLELAHRLRADRGLQISAILDGAPHHLEELVFFATCVDVYTRFESVREFLTHLDAVEEELTRPEPAEHVDPLEKSKGDELDGGFVVLKRLGKGSSSVALLVERGAEESVLKVALGPEHHDRLRDEAAVLEKLRHQHVCAVHGLVELGDRLALHMERAGEQTLGQRLRSEGPLHLELLERFGEDLLHTLDWLEQQGIPHRDVKPENIGIHTLGKKGRLHLVLFDFSLSRTPAENIRAGTVPYLDPFLPLRKPPRWDLHAERFAAAMTLHEMATGVLPVWGDGRSDPAMIDAEVHLEPSRFDPDLREALTAFFTQALRRDYARRFGNTFEMLKAWRDVFKESVRQPSVEPAGDVLLGEALASATLETPLAQLGLGTRALNALDRADVIDVRGLLSLPPLAVNTMRGVGSKTRREITAVMKRLAARFPHVQPVVPGPEPADTVPGGEEEAPTAAPLEALRRSIDLIADTLVPRARRKSAKEDVLRRLLGLDDEAAPPDPVAWPNQTDVATACQITRARVGQVLGQARRAWAEAPVLQELAEEIGETLARRGGTLSTGELAAALLATRGSVHREPRRTRLASAVARAVVEAEATRAEPRFGFWRAGARTLVAVSADAADYASRLGRAADALAAEDPLPTPARVAERLGRVKRPDGVAPVAASRLVPLAAAASQNAAVSSRLELYPRGMAPDRTLKLAHGALVGASQLTTEALRERVLGRYPEAAPLPERPELDRLLAEAGLDLHWDAETGSFQPQERPTTSSAYTRSLPRYPTTLSRSTEVTPEVAEARQFQARLQHGFDQGGFLALTVPTRHLLRAEKELLGHFDLERRSLEAALVQAMKDEAQRASADWTVVRRADAAPRDSSDWSHLMRLVRRSVAAVERELLEASGRLLLVHPGLLGRYDQVESLGRLREALQHPGSVHALWVLVPSDGPGDLPTLDGQAVPVFAPGQWARIPDAWLKNLHRSHPPAAGTEAPPS